ncbi:type II toxin-antitoxin system VapC family toxin [Coraliomargarita parva]|uniref:type II toxin-antitoxin system VapC family toxin n=1 Tax=Coraliomargarita parva TaxID=3014050 RepID=UPI0022B3CD32|nr:type II toxin-antitoxin system VapC family toxin [Coraliomargarita parva]
MSDYADTGFICSLYAPDANTEQALAFMEKQSDAIAFSWLNQVEFRNALRLRVFRKEITAAQRDQSLNILLADLRDGIFINEEPSQSNVLIESERLSVQHSEKLGTRSLDILHVAMAIVLGCERFISFDARQIKLAKAAGFKVPRL